LLGDRLGDTRKLDGFRRLDHLTRAIEEGRDPFADSSAAVPRFSHERKISASFAGRTVFDDRGSKKPAVTLHSNPGITLVCFNPFLGFKCIVTALNSRIVAHKTRTKFLLKFVRDISTKMTLSSFRASFFGPGFEYRQLCGFRDLNAAK
jgi:hypothetical protein